MSAGQRQRVGFGLLTAAMLAAGTSAPAVPSPPRAVRAEPVSMEAVRLQWIDAAQNETGYVIERSTDNHRFVTAGTTAADAVCFTNTGLAAGTLYFFRVRALGADGDSEPSNWHFAATYRPVSTNHEPAFVKASWTPDRGAVVDWREHFGDETGFLIERGTNVNDLTVLGTNAADTTSFLDPGPLPADTPQYYRVTALGPASHSAPGYVACVQHRTCYGSGIYTYGTSCTDSLVPPADVTVEKITTGSTRIRWTDLATNEAAYYVLHSWDNRHFWRTGQVDSNTTEFVHDDYVFPEAACYYRVAAASAQGYSWPSTSAVITLTFDDGLTAPSNLTASVTSSNHVLLAWEDGAEGETGFAIEYGNGARMLNLDTVGPNVTQYTCTHANAHLYRYRVQATGVSGDSRYTPAVDPDPDTGTENWGAPSVSAETPDPRTNAVYAAGTPATAAVTIGTHVYGGYRQLSISGTDGNDIIEVASSNAFLTVAANGQPVQAWAGPFGEVVIRGGAGNDTLIVHTGVTARVRLYGQTGNDALNAFGSGKAFLVTVGGGSDTAAGNGLTTSYWTDEDGVDTVFAGAAEIAGGHVHRVAGFYNGVSKEPLGQNLSESGMFLYESASYTRFPDSSLWGLGPGVTDVNQGFHQNCYDTGAYQAFAQYQPDRLEEMAVDLGDGTFAVQYGSPAAQTYARVDGDLRDGYLACIGPNSNLWWMVMEKVISWGYRLADPGPTWQSTLDMYTDGESLHRAVREQLDRRAILTTYNSGFLFLDAPVADHGHNYAILETYRDAGGAPRFIVRDPYGVHYKHSWPPDDPNAGLKDLSLAELQANFGEVTLADYRFVHADAGDAVVIIDADGDGMETVTLDGGGSVSPAGPLTDYAWWEGSTLLATGVAVNVALPLGNHRIDLLVTDLRRARGHDVLTVQVVPVGGLRSLGECGTVSTNQPHGGVWHTLNFGRRFHNPVVLMGPMSEGDTAPATLRVRNVDTLGCEWQIDEWDYLSSGLFSDHGAHGVETAGYVVLEAGSHTVAGGGRLEAGYTTADSSWTPVTFQESFAGPPVVFSQVTTVNDDSAVVTRHANVTATGFELRLQGQESRPDHGAETVAWMALAPGNIATGAFFCVAGTTPISVTHNWYAQAFGHTFSNPPVLLAGMQTTEGGDPAALRYQALTSSSVQLRVEEETSSDSETSHAAEACGFLAMGGAIWPETLPEDGDGDGLPDPWERAWFGGTNVVHGAPDEDWDHDGASDREEFAAGTCPTNDQSFFALSGIASGADEVVLHWPSVAGKAYRVHVADSLSGSFDPIPALLPATQPLNTYTDTVPAAVSRYYRLSVE